MLWRPNGSPVLVTDDPVSLSAAEFLLPIVAAEAAMVPFDAGEPTATDFKVGLSIQQPPLFRSASAGVQTAYIMVQRSRLQHARVERGVEADVRNAVVGCATRY